MTMQQNLGNPQPRNLSPELEVQLTTMSKEGPRLRPKTSALLVGSMTKKMSSSFCFHFLIEKQGCYKLKEMLQVKHLA